MGPCWRKMRRDRLTNDHSNKHGRKSGTEERTHKRQFRQPNDYIYFLKKVRTYEISYLDQFYFNIKSRL